MFAHTKNFIRLTWKYFPTLFAIPVAAVVVTVGVLIHSIELTIIAICIQIFVPLYDAWFKITMINMRTETIESFIKIFIDHIVQKEEKERESNV
jgi:hypothetical protein